MAEFKISRFRYTWRGNWNSSTNYIRDDIVRYAGNTYVCIKQHTASPNFYTDLNYIAPGEITPSPAWVIMTSGFSWRGEWSQSTLYNLNDIISYGGTVYICANSYTSGSVFEDGLSNWAVYAIGFDFKLDWEPNTRYGAGDTVAYGGIVYRCLIGHTSNNEDNGLEFDQSKWETISEGRDFKGDWTSGSKYKVNDLVVFGGTLFKCKEGHVTGTDSTLNFDFEEHWEIELPGFQSSGEWNSTTVYQIGDVVKHGGYLYYSLTNNYNRIPSSSIYQIEDMMNPIEWIVLSKGIDFKGTWNRELSYKTGDVVRRGGNLYVALLDTDLSADGSSLDYLDSSNWELLTEGQLWRGEWASTVNYQLNEVVSFRGSVYKCNFPHSSSFENFPGDSGSGLFYWDILLLGSDQVGMRSRGDLLTFGLSRSIVGDGSSFGLTDVPIGNAGEVLSVNINGDVSYRQIGALNRVFYVSVDGVDSVANSSRGTQFSPWKTIRFACEQADDGFEGSTTIRVTAGTYEEILPIIVPVRTAIVGSELRTTVIKASSPIDALALDSTYTIAVLTRLSILVEPLILGQINTIVKSTGNTLNPTALFDVTNVPIVGDEESFVATQLLIANIISYINFYVNSTGSEPSVTGTNTATVDGDFLAAASVLEANKDFLIEEAVAFMQAEYPSYSFDSDLCRRDTRRYLEAIIYDLTYTGNYKSILAARYYKNAILGSASEDMFYLRDATGLRNCTLAGLDGRLNPPNVFDLYRLPTGGAYCSLDPGWGPDDNRTWISTRSPYIQNVTTTGTGCVGQKIDGALHAGGNKSFVSNDFTQVIDDGIGAWVLNAGRAELVSVFTYYSHVGYLAQNGGIIRSANGNNSYGRFGIVSDGVDDTETPKTATVNNRNNEATVTSVLAGGENDQIKVFEFSNCGQNYTTATASVVASGSGLSVLFDEIRDDAVFQARLLDTSTSITQNVGGGGYSVIQNNAQLSETPGADLTSIVIAGNDPNLEADYLGMRIIIVSGPGTGQYGVITGYNTTTKLVDVQKESTGQPGWDHVISGLPLIPAFTQNTTYRIEPRVTFTGPGFESSAVPISTHNYLAVEYGETTKTFLNRAGAVGTGTVITDDGLTPITATFNILKSGRNYTVTLNNPGAGYEVGQTFTILGSTLGGTTPENDIEIEITQISDDSTNSILDFTYHGVGTSGVFVSTTNTNEAVYSEDGEEWNESTNNLPSSGVWKSLAAGQNKFVAIRYNSAAAAVSLDGATWGSRSMPASREWNAVVYGNDRFVAVSGNLNAAAYSLDGNTWVSSTMPTVGDSTLNEWVDVTYGKNRFVAIANSQNIAAHSVDGVTWTGTIMDVITDSTQKDWVSVTYGNNRFVAISSSGEVAYSFDGEDWYPALLPTQDGSTPMYWKDVKYGQGVFFAVCTSGVRDEEGNVTENATIFAATSPDGIVWTGQELASEKLWTSVAFGNPYIDQLDSTVGKSTPMWVAVGFDTDRFNKIRTGATAIGRVDIAAGVISRVKLLEPGSGYVDPPTITIYDPNRTSAAAVENRLGDGVLSNPTYLDRGSNYRSATTSVTISGDGFADEIPVGKFVTLSFLEAYPGPGAQILFEGNSQRYTIVTVESKSLELPELGLSARFRITPELKVRDNLQHDVSVEIRELYSQVRVTGHDFLDIGTGSFEETNYPNIYQGFYNYAPENEVVEEDGGRVFYTSTDQNGNFRTGELFAVEQSTGIVTISADFFDLSGLSELRLGGIRVGGTGAVIREFSTDPLFTADSNNIVPTQRAIKAYLNNRLTVGGSEIITNSFVAGQIRVGIDEFRSTASGSIVMQRRADFNEEFSAIRGSIIAQAYFMKTVFNND